MNPPRPVVAVVDDEPQMRKALRRLLATHGLLVDDYHCGRDFLDALGSRPVDCVVLDLHMLGGSGFDVLTALAAEGQTQHVVVITGHDQPGTQERALGLGAAAYLTKPVDESALLAAIHSVLRNTRVLPT